MIIRHDGVIKLLSKGADSIIIERLSPNGSSYLELMERKLEIFANKGLRTLCFGMKVLGEEEWLEI